MQSFAKNQVYEKQSATDHSTEEDQQTRASLQGRLTSQNRDRQLKKRLKSQVNRLPLSVYPKQYQFTKNVDKTKEYMDLNSVSSAKRCNTSLGNNKQRIRKLKKIHQNEQEDSSDEKKVSKHQNNQSLTYLESEASQMKKANNTISHN